MTNIFLLDLIPLQDAKQSSEYKNEGCAPDKCSASAAIDDNLNTEAITLRDQWEWWSAQLSQRALIHKIYIYPHKNSLDRGYYNRFSVETNDNGGWTVCKREHKMEYPYNPHILECETLRIAKYIRLSVRGGGALQLLEVKVFGTPYQGKIFLL